MMLEAVCIVLNEREPHKAKAAEGLVAALDRENITSSRVGIDENIEELISEKCPKILVIDYLLGDYSTGLDILSQLREIAPSRRPKTIFLTDEPSVSVAVEAMRLGAEHYIEIERPSALDEVVREVKELLRKTHARAIIPRKAPPALNSLVAHSKPMQDLIQRAQLLCQQQCPIIVIIGGHGAGKATLADALHLERSSSTKSKSSRAAAIIQTLRLDMRTFDEEVDQFFCGHSEESLNFRVGREASLTVLHAEEDDGELIRYVSDHMHSIWPAGSMKENNGLLVVCTSEPETARAWERLTKAKLLVIPPLDRSRKEDFAGLVQRFILEAGALAGEKVKPFDGETVTWLTSLEWKGNVGELRSTVVDAALAGLHTQSQLERFVEERRAVEEQSPTASRPELVSALTAATILESCDFSYRIAAAKLGCSVRHLKEMVRTGGRAYD